MRTLVLRVFLGASAILTLGCLLVWVWSYFSSVGLFSLPFDTDARIRLGSVEWRHTYALKVPIPARDWPGDPIPPRRIVPKVKTFAGFGFSAGHEHGYVYPWSSESVQPAEYWILLTPMWCFLVFLGSPWAVVAVFRFRSLLTSGSTRRRGRRG